MKKNKNKTVQVLTTISVVIGLVLGLLILYFWQRNTNDVSFIRSLPILLLTVVVMGIGTVVGLVIGALVHELGHLISGLAVGMRFHFFEIFSIQIRSPREGRIFYRMKDRSLANIALGRVAMQMKEGVTKNGLRLHYSAGFMANLLMVLLIFFIDWSRAGLVDMILASIAVVNSYLFITNALPLHQREFYSDGDVLELLKDDTSDTDEGHPIGPSPKSEAEGFAPSFYECQHIEAQIAGGKRPKDIGLIRVSGSRDLVKVMQAMLGFLQAVDAEDYDRAGEYIDYIRPNKTPLLNLDASERLAYCAIYDSWLEPNASLLREDFRSNELILEEALSDLAKIAQYFRDSFHYEEGIVPYPSREELAEDYDYLEALIGKDENVGMRLWSHKILRDRRASLSEVRQVTTKLGEERV